MVKSNANVKITRELKAPEGEGVHYRLLCMTGENKGLSYYLKGRRAIIGRGDRADVQITDTKSSREHAELTLHSGTYVLTDLGSQNGVIVNDLKISQHTLEDGDKIIIGQTVLKFSIVKNDSPLTLVEDDEEESEEESNALASPSKKKTKKGKAQGKDDGAGRKKLIYGVVALLVVLMMLPESEKQAQQEEPTTPIARDDGTVFETGAARPMQEEDREQERKLNAVLHRGLREFREGNYFRAMEEFNFALLMSPNHGRATFYLNRTKQRLDEEIEQNFFKARQEVDALKYDAAIVSYCSIMRLLRDYKDDERYKLAETEIDNIRRRIGYQENENLCITGE